MSAKFLHAFTDENPELQKQIGCMTGIFQMFDRHHLIAGRRVNGQNHKRFPSGHAIVSSSVGTECGSGSPQIVLEKNFSKSFNENKRISMESSRTSFSSSSCSSFSSIECSKSIQQEALSFDRTIMERTLKSSPKVNIAATNGRPPRYEPHKETTNMSAQSGRRSLDFRDVVKDSINRDSHRLSVKTTKEEVKNHVMRHKDSPRPMQLSRSVDGSYAIGINRKSGEPVELNESLRALVKPKESPWNFSEVGESPRPSFEAKGTPLYPGSREAHRFSYDGREVSRQSLDSRERSKPSSKLQELPRLSLDSREGSTRHSSFETKPNSILRDLDKRNINQRLSKPSNLEQELGSHKRSTSVVAKLMGLESMPSLSLSTQEVMDLALNSNKVSDHSIVQRPKSSKASQDSRYDKLNCSPNSSIKDPVTPKTYDANPVIKTLSNSRVPTETAPWRQQERLRVPQKSALVCRDSPQKQQPESVYGEIEKRLKELEFRQSNKDLRALKQILDAMQEKGLLETKKGEQIPAGDDPNLKSASTRNPKIIHPGHKLVKGIDTQRAFESPIVIMKPAKSVNRPGLAPSVIPLEGLSGLHKLRTGDSMDRKKASADNKMAKEQTPKASPGEFSDKKIYRTEENPTQKVRSRAMQGSSRPPQSPRENSGSSVKTSSSSSLRLQQKRLESERRPHHPVSPSESSKSHRLSANRQPLESVSPRGKLRRKHAQVEENDEQLSENSEMRNFSNQGDEISQRSDSNISLASQVDIEVTSADRSAIINSSFSTQGSRSPSSRALRKVSSVLKQKKTSISLSEEVLTKGNSASAPEQPSPISVLDASFYQDDLSPSPVKKTSSGAKDEKIQISERCWNATTLPDAPTLKMSSEINHKKLQSIKNLVEKLRELSSTDDEPHAIDHIASLCETQSPDHRYVSEILLASGLLLKDLSSGPMGPMPFQLHSSGHPINPDLFLVLEQTKTGLLSKPKSINENSLHPESNQEKLHRKLVFDLVNDVLIQKLEISSNLNHLVQARRLTRFPSGQQLLKELCLEIEQLQSKSSKGENSEDDIKISDEEVLRQSDGWADFSREVPGLVLEIERLLFKDLIDEVVNGEAVSSLHSKTSRRRRQLFAK